MSIIIVVHIVVTFDVNVPGCGKGYIGPGGLHDGGKHFNCTGGIAGYIDRAVFGDHIYKHPTCEKVYESDLYYDPEGNIIFSLSVRSNFKCNCFIFFLCADLVKNPYIKYYL